jgi:hypothetical protein
MLQYLVWAYQPEKVDQSDGHGNPALGIASEKGFRFCWHGLSEHQEYHESEGSVHYGALIPVSQGAYPDEGQTNTNNKRQRRVPEE